jgi:Cupin superfamily protein
MCVCVCVVPAVVWLFSLTELADWIDSYFAAWLPRWRRDDAQMSIAKTGGGIGPHVDNYDVFLVQTSGERRWKIANELLSATNETELLIPNIPVSILNVTKLEASTSLEEVLLKPGDCLYLPPRVVHWGTAASDDCVTLSIGCRAPSAADLLTRLGEHVMTQGALHPTAVHRYNDSRSESKGESATLSMTTKEEMKLMVRRAVDAVLDDDELWDALVGRLTTEPLRYSSASDILVPYKDENEEYRERWGATAQAALDNVRTAGATAALIRNHGISLATSTLHGVSAPTIEEGSVPPPLPQVDRLWACGRMWELADCKDAASIFRTIEQGDLLDGDTIQGVPESLQALLCNLLEEGVLQVCDLLDPSEEEGEEDSPLEP